MRFTIIAASLIAAVAAQYSAAADETCSAVVTVTVTETLAHTPIAPSASSAPYYPTSVVVPSGGVAMPTGSGSPLVPDASSVMVPVAGGVGYPTGAVPVAGGAGYPSGVPAASGTAAPSGTGAAGAPYPEFTGAASGLKVGGVLAGVGAVAALFL